MRGMTPQEKQDQLNANWLRYVAERDRLAAEGKAIGTFSSWQFENKLVSITIPMSRDEFFGKP